MGLFFFFSSCCLDCLDVTGFAFVLCPFLLMLIIDAYRGVEVVWSINAAGARAIKIGLKFIWRFLLIVSEIGCDAIGTVWVAPTLTTGTYVI